MTELDALVCSLSRPDRTVAEVAALAGCDRGHVYRCIQRYGLTLKQRRSTGPRSDLSARVLALANGVRTSEAIATQLGCSTKHVQNVLRMHGAARLPRGAQRGERNHGYVGRLIDLDGYALVLAPAGHPHARGSGHIYEHRLLMERHLGRHLRPQEVVDHIDGLHLHNDASNLRVFASNADHLRATIAGQRPDWSPEGLEKMRRPSPLRPAYPRVDSYRQRREAGDVRLLQILLASSRLGIDSPHLLGTRRHLEQAQIDPSCRSTIERALADRFPEWA